MSAPAELTPHERKVLNLLRAPSPFSVTTKCAIYDALYGDHPNPPFPKVIDVWVCRLRKKLDIDIECVWGRGYTLAAETRERLDRMFGPLQAEAA